MLGELSALLIGGEGLSPKARRALNQHLYRTNWSPYSGEELPINDLDILIGIKKTSFCQSFPLFPCRQLPYGG